MPAHFRADLPAPREWALDSIGSSITAQQMADRGIWAVAPAGAPATNNHA
ncbi:hypothetical protein [Nocardiopsis ansamitocini]|nr:hypothetical protein [Nocardiopsis ansamitocini]